MFLRIGLAGLLLVGAAVHIYFSLVQAQATVLAGEESVESLEAAHRLVPANAAYLARLAEIDEGRAPMWLEQALALHPRAGVLWMEKGVTQEVQGDAAAAEKSFLEAARLDQQYATRWTLTAFYFRQQNRPQFARWAKQAMELLYLKDPRPILQMALALGMTPTEIRQGLLADRAPVYRAFIYECLRQEAWDEAAEAAKRLIAISPGDVEIERDRDQTAILTAVDALHGAGRMAAAIATWNTLTAAHWVPHQALGPERLVANPGFAFEFLPRGFDWRPRTVEGTSVWRRPGSGGALHVELTGRQPQRCVLLTLPVPMEPGRRYTLRVKSAAEGLRGAKGLTWRIGNEEWDASQGDLTATFALPAEAAPPAPAAGAGPAPKPMAPALVLQYARALGTKRVEGTLLVNEVRISAEAAQEAK